MAADASMSPTSAPLSFSASSSSPPAAMPTRMDTSLDPFASSSVESAMSTARMLAWITLDEISFAAFICSSNATDMISEERLMLFIISDTSLMTATASRVFSCIADMRPAISSAACVLWRANSLISFATTANPLPASPADAASMWAFNASIFVLSAIFLMTSVTSPIWLAASPSESIVSPAFSAMATASLLISDPL